MPIPADAPAVAAVERLALIRAAIERRGERDAALRELGLEADEWLALQRSTLALFAQADAAALELGHRYRMAYETARSSEAVDSSAAVAGPTPTQPGVPSYLRPSGAQAPPVRISVQQSPPPDVTAEQVNPLSGVVTPFRPLDSEALGLHASALCRALGGHAPRKRGERAR